MRAWKEWEISVTHKNSDVNKISKVKWLLKDRPEVVEWLKW